MGRLGGFQLGGTQLGHAAIERRVATLKAEPMGVESDRTVSLNRESTTSVQPLTVSVSRVVRRRRAAEMSVDPLRVLADRTTSLSRSGTLSVAPLRVRADFRIPNWAIEGRQVSPRLEERRTWQELVLSFRPNKDVLDEVFRPLDTAAEQFDLVERADGSFTVVDRSRGESQVTVDPPTNREVIRTTTEYHLAEYDERTRGQSGEAFEVELSLVAAEPKQVGDYGSVTAADDEWLFEFADGSVATDRIEHDIGRGGEDVEGAIEISMALTLEETAVVEDSLNRLSAARVREVPDGRNLAEDNNPDSRNTITVETPETRDPDDRLLEPGEYVAVDYQSGLINDEFSQVSLSLLPKG